MFAPFGGLHEDRAAGRAGATLVALLLSLGSGENDAAEIVQGVEMGRPSLMRASACRTAHGIRAHVGGSCVPVLRGEELL
jgi:trans-2,3-dihydro-3-hydroxyanthranilate isomerase